MTVLQERAGEQETLDFRDFSRDHLMKHEHLARAKVEGGKAKA